MFFFIISNIMVKTFFHEQLSYLIAKVERNNKLFYLKHEIILYQIEKRSKTFPVKTISKDVRKTIVPSFMFESFHIKSPNFSKLSMVTLSDFPETLWSWSMPYEMKIPKIWASVYRSQDIAIQRSNLFPKIAPHRKFFVFWCHF